MREVTPEKFVKVLATGIRYDANDIQEYLEDYISKHSNQRWVNHDFRFDTQDKYHYIYDNECYLFVEDGKVTVRCDRERVDSEGINYIMKIDSEKSIARAYELFYEMTIEEEKEQE